jgi:plastocyanin
MRVVAAVGTLALVLPGSAVLAGTITGKVVLGHAMEAERTVVYVENVPEAKLDHKSPAAIKLSQRGAQFKPRVLPVVRGTEVDMTNDDWVSHSVFSRATSKTFDLGIYGQDVRKSVVFDRPGVVQIFCAIHPRMNGVVLVLQNPFFAKPAADGSFAIDGVPPGSYQVRVYKQGSAVPATNVTVPASGSVTVTF